MLGMVEAQKFLWAWGPFHPSWDYYSSGLKKKKVNSNTQNARDMV